MNNNDTAKILTDNFEFGLEITIDKLFTDKLESDIIKSWVNTAEKKIDIKKRWTDNKKIIFKNIEFKYYKWWECTIPIL